LYGGTSKTYRISSSISSARPTPKIKGIAVKLAKVKLPYSLNAHNGAIIARDSTAMANRKMAKVVMMLFMILTPNKFIG
jgi:hypothetical protein